MTPLIALLGLALLVGGMISFARLGLGRQADLLSGLFRAPDLGWPRGVQEEDPPPSWRSLPRTEPARIEVDWHAPIPPRVPQRR